MWGKLAMGDVAVRVLGQIEVLVKGRTVRLTAGRLRTLLAVLAMSAGRPVSVDHLADAVWGEELPGNARRSLQTYAGRLRTILAGARLDSTRAGFTLHVDADDVDALRFLRLLDDAARRSGAAERALLVEALGLWGGEPFAGIDSEWLRENHAPRLVERYLSAIERRIDLDLAGGRHGDLAAELGELTARYPLRESLWVRLLVTLARSGRHAEALDAYETIRGRITAELGVDPGVELRRVHADLVAGRTPGVQRAGSGSAPAVVTPRQLPAAIDRFAGRDEAMKDLDALLNDGAPTPSSALCVITGAAGVGKTTLAVRWARQAVDRFPDGQLYADLGGFGPSEKVADSADVIRDFLEAIGVAPARMPTNAAALSGLFRTMLTGKRVLILLDNARDADQVRALLPSSGGCLTLVTSRNDLAGLVVTEGARLVPLDVLSSTEAWQLLTARLGRDRLEREPTAVDAIIRSCARLPLALAIAAARATVNRSLSMAALAAGLRDSRDDLGTLDAGDEATNVRTVFSWSYRTVSSEAARLFRLLGLHLGRDISVSAAASLIARPRSTTRVLLTQLEQANLANRTGADRYRSHDLLWRYARELAEQKDTEDERRAAVRRLLDHYLDVARAADGLLDPLRDPIPTHATVDGVVGERLPDKESALAWLRTERYVLLAVCEQAAASGFDSHVWQLAWAMSTFQDRQGLWHDWVWTQRLALDAAERLEDESEIARAHRALARALTRLNRYAEAREHFTRAVQLYSSLDDPVGQAITHINLGWMSECQKDFVHALHHNERALELFKECDHEVGQAKVLNAIGWDYANLGDHAIALSYCQRAMKLNQDLDEVFGQAETWDSLGYIHLHLGEHQQSIACYEQALRLHDDLGSDALVASVLRDLGDAHALAGDIPAARSHYLRSLEILEQLHHPDADEVRTRLRRSEDEDVTH